MGRMTKGLVKTVAMWVTLHLENLVFENRTTSSWESPGVTCIQKGLKH